jgi:hypothetical protein
MGEMEKSQTNVMRYEQFQEILACFVGNHDMDNQQWASLWRNKSIHKATSIVHEV